VRHRYLAAAAFRKAVFTMTTTIRISFAFAAMALVLAGCGGGGSNDAASRDIPNGGGGVNGISVGNCLNLEDFLVQPSQTTLDGQSPAGVSFSLRFYPTNDLAATAFKKKDPKTTAKVENAVIDFKGNPSPYAGAPPAKISQTELTVIKQCIDQNKEES
jgi:hypothetical protein